MGSLVIGAGGLILLFGAILATLAKAAGEDAGAMLAVVLGAVVVTAIVVFFALQLSIGLIEVFHLNE